MGLKHFNRFSRDLLIFREKKLRLYPYEKSTTFKTFKLLQLTCTDGISSQDDENHIFGMINAIVLTKNEKKKSIN